MTATAKITNPAQESSRAGFGKPEIHAKVLAELERVAPGCGPVFGPVSEADHQYIHAHAFAGSFTVTFTGAERRLVISEVPYMGRCFWVCHDYRSTRTRKPKVRQWVDDLKLMADNMAYDLRDDTRRMAATSGPLDMVAGDILYSSWGYNQTNIDFYKVLSVTASGQSAVIVAVGENRNDDGMMGGTTTPRVDDVRSEPVTRRKYDRQTLHGFRSSGALLRKWDGKPCRYTSYA